MDRNSIIVGGVYTITRRDLGGTRYTALYDGRQFINVRVVAVEDGHFVCATRDENGRHLGPGNCWISRDTLILRPEDLEPSQA